MTIIHHPLYSTWRGIKARCNDKNHKAYKHYGGRGIKLCTEWESFDVFCRDVGDKPVGHTIDRKDPDGDYCAANCQWVTQTEQIKNQRVRCDNGSGIKGVSWFHRTNRWFVYINHDKKRIALGYYECFFDACCVRKSAEHHVWNGQNPYQYIESVKDRLRAVPNSGIFKNGHTTTRKQKSIS